MTSTRDHTAMLSGHEFAYLDSGQGPALLFIHGLTGSQRNWAQLVEALNHDHRVIAPDLFGHGASAKVMGDYFGGGIAMQFCYLFPDRVERLVLVSSGGLGRDVSPLLRAATLPGAEWVLPLIASSWVRRRVEALARILAGGGWRASPEVTEIWRGFTSLGDPDTRRAF